MSSAAENSAFPLRLVSCTPESGRTSILGRFEYHGDGRCLSVVVTARGYVMFPDGPVAADLKQAIEVEALKILTMMLRADVVRGANAKGILRRLEGRPGVHVSPAKARTLNTGAAA
ncbi:hypothetical protein [Roseomonas chloroacetimidivorans]|uniref:hypothetical protein n=1 Tax=Roseomonas chloroacetimidivorans TaxID=1766656 RepID=UPI003C755592